MTCGASRESGDDSRRRRRRVGDCDDPQITRAVVDSFPAAVQSRSSDAVAACFPDAARYANVPHPPAIGPAAILTVFRPILRRSQGARWDIVSSAYDGATAWLQRVDRFWIDGQEYAVECNGVYTGSVTRCGAERPPLAHSPGH